MFEVRGEDLLENLLGMFERGSPIEMKHGSEGDAKAVAEGDATGQKRGSCVESRARRPSPRTSEPAS